MFCHQQKDRQKKKNDAKFIMKTDFQLLLCVLVQNDLPTGRCGARWRLREQKMSLSDLRTLRNKHAQFNFFSGTLV